MFAFDKQGYYVPYKDRLLEPVNVEMMVIHCLMEGIRVLGNSMSLQTLMAAEIRVEDIALTIDLTPN